jgi:hypothetical protein
MLWPRALERQFQFISVRADFRCGGRHMARPDALTAIGRTRYGRELVPGSRGLVCKQLVEAAAMSSEGKGARSIEVAASSSRTVARPATSCEPVLSLAPSPPTHGEHDMDPARGFVNAVVMGSAVWCMIGWMACRWAGHFG